MNSSSSIIVCSHCKETLGSSSGTYTELRAGRLCHHLYHSDCLKEVCGSINGQGKCKFEVEDGAQCGKSLYFKDALTVTAPTKPIDEIVHQLIGESTRKTIIDLHQDKIHNTEQITRLSKDCIKHLNTIDDLQKEVIKRHQTMEKMGIITSTLWKAMIPKEDAPNVNLDAALRSDTGKNTTNTTDDDVIDLDTPSLEGTNGKSNQSSVPANTIQIGDSTVIRDNKLCKNLLISNTSIINENNVIKPAEPLSSEVSDDDELNFEQVYERNPLKKRSLSLTPESTNNHRSIVHSSRNSLNININQTDDNGKSRNPRFKKNRRSSVSKSLSGISTTKAINSVSLKQFKIPFKQTDISINGFPKTGDFATFLIKNDAVIDPPTYRELLDVLPTSIDRCVPDEIVDIVTAVSDDTHYVVTGNIANSRELPELVYFFQSHLMIGDGLCFGIAHNARSLSDSISRNIFLDQFASGKILLQNLKTAGIRYPKRILLSTGNVGIADEWQLQKLQRETNELIQHFIDCKVERLVILPPSFVGNTASIAYKFRSWLRYDVSRQTKGISVRYVHQIERILDKNPPFGSVENLVSQTQHTILEIVLGLINYLGSDSLAKDSILQHSSLDDPPAKHQRHY
ncbi:unnamed protein product [Allacma fusca]|uniref:Uncharacterized protein n=1 Tax=Allacma fusca TaxID=39272 RepID=A0A8J2JQZ7_9HEXA|nr:unnamed protein product [Allacma fusca]